MASSPWSSLPWKRVDTATLPEPSSSSGNHYDDDSSKKKGNELGASPQEAVAMFVGLEVISGDDYQVHAGKFKQINKSDDDKKARQGEETPVEERTKQSTAVDDKTKTKKRKRKKASDNGDDEVVDPQQQEEQQHEEAIPEEREEPEQPKKKKRKKKKKKKAKQQQETGTASSEQQQQEVTKSDEATDRAAHTSTFPDDNTPSTTIEVEQLQTSWSMATGGVQLHPLLCQSLLSQSFDSPTPIQSSTLAAAILGRRNIVGAAPTGSGKTLAYLLPILQSLLSNEQQDNPRMLQALILTPTRELALQVSRECDKLCSPSIRKWCGTIVGGLAMVKQQRVLQKSKPPILVATPGRLWELMSSGDYNHLENLSRLQFLVIDEADRMISQGNFPQLLHIFNAIHAANPIHDSDSDGEEDYENDDEEEEDRLQALPGIPGEAKVEMLGDVLERMRQQQEGGGVDEGEPEPMELNDEEFQELHQLQQKDLDEQEEDDDIELPVAPPVHRQTFVYSATLTLPPSASYVAKVTKQNKKKKGKSKKAVTVEGAIAEILEKARAKGQTKVVDLTSRDKRDVLAPSQRESTQVSKESCSSRLPPGLSLHKIECTQRHKDSHLYAYLVTTAQGASGPCLVFCNSIAAVRRVGATLQALRLPVRMLHANMAQKARLKAVESLGEPRSIVVATDVAARGLDIPSVATVVHYDVARQVDTFIHRAGRTARGMGKGAVGSSLSLIAPGEDKAHNKVCEALHSKHLFEEVHMDGRLLAAAQERANLAAKVVECDEVETKAQKSNKWFQEAAEEAGLDLDDDMLDEGLAGGDRRDQHKLREAKAARARLRQLLAQPMQTQRFGKFLSSNSAATQPEVVAYVVPLTNDRKSKKKRRGKRR